jgi:hypothetical protein
MNKSQADFFAHAVPTVGLSVPDAIKLIQAARALHRWAEEICNGTIQADETKNPAGCWETTGKYYRYYEIRPGEYVRSNRVPDRETAALKRAQVIAEKIGATIEHQGDPRGAVLTLKHQEREYAIPDYN